MKWRAAAFLGSRPGLYIGIIIRISSLQAGRTDWSKSLPNFGGGRFAAQPRRFVQEDHYYERLHQPNRNENGIVTLGLIDFFLIPENCWSREVLFVIQGYFINFAIILTNYEKNKRGDRCKGR